MHTLSTSFVLGYHGCDAEVAERLLGGEDFRQSTNAYDWLGHGIYFWEANPIRGLEYARHLKKHPRGSVRIETPAVVGAAIDLGLCLDLTTSAGIKQVEIAHARFQEITIAAGLAMPENSKNLLKRNLDCAVIQTLHKIRSDESEVAIDAVRGVFIEGKRIYPNAGFYRKTHTQVCVRNTECIKGVFRVPKRNLKSFGGA